PSSTNPRHRRRPRQPLPHRHNPSPKARPPLASLSKPRPSSRPLPVPRNPTPPAVALVKPFSASNMSIVIPIHKPQPQQPQQPPPVAPPDPNYLLMAAAQMHSEGRLVKPANG